MYYTTHSRVVYYRLNVTFPYKPSLLLRHPYSPQYSNSNTFNTRINTHINLNPNLRAELQVRVVVPTLMITVWNSRALTCHSLCLFYSTCSLRYYTLLYSTILYYTLLYSTIVINLLKHKSAPSQLWHRQSKLRIIVLYLLYLLYFTLH